MAPGFSQLALPPSLPPLPPLQMADPSAAELSQCVPRFGNVGCAARLYARLLCNVVGQTASPAGLQQQLAGQYERAAIDFRGISVAEVESAALRDQVPLLCAARSQQIQQLFAPLPQAIDPDSPG